MASINFSYVFSEDNNSLVEYDTAIEVERTRQKYINEIEPDNKLSAEIGIAGVEIYKSYISVIKDNYIPLRYCNDSFHDKNRTLFFEIKKWVDDLEENTLDKLVSVYHTLSDEQCNIALIYDRDSKKSRIYLAISDESKSAKEKDRTQINYLGSTLVSALKGNFPGIDLKQNDETFNGIDKSTFYGIPDCIKRYGNNACCVAAITNVPSEKSDGYISQRMEKILDGIIPEDQERYTLILLATPSQNCEDEKFKLYDLYNKIAPFSGYQYNVSSNKTNIKNEGHSQGYSGSISGGISTEFIIANASANANFGVNFAKHVSSGKSYGTTTGITRTHTNYAIKHSLDNLEIQIKRIEESAALGMWKFSAYVVANKPRLARNVSHMYLSLTQGELSYIGNSAINLWNIKDKGCVENIMSSLVRLRHPIFVLNHDILNHDPSYCMYPSLVDATSLISGKELAKALNFPRKSVSGIPVLKSVAYGREVQKFVSSEPFDNRRNIEIGRVYHMRHEEENPVTLDVDSLTSHIFVAGSTGTGKSNTIYQILDKLQKNEVKFLVVEPAKGEYKKILGGYAKVYGTNDNKSELLHINPFSFPANDIHVLEHIDRLIEIFNACWPMYAAMPAILKDAVENCYEKVGWNLRFSKCEPLNFPTFNDLMESLPKVMDSSMYSADTKSDYAGALITRVRSMTNGINGQIFCSNKELTDNDLFNQNVIVDLSRVGSNETKSLMMGILVMKLQEYRLMLDAMNEKLIHVTVLEEAHNLLRRTSLSQSQEGANLQGKSVEMITNSIAEMRTYGEGFIIADQSPGLLDEAVIRNTNTKIVFRLPDKYDREVVGTSMALSDDQITELAKLPRGVAAVYQNDWIEAILCSFKKFDKVKPLLYTKPDTAELYEKYFSIAFGVNDLNELSPEDVDVVNEWIRSLRESEGTVKILKSVLAGNKLSTQEKEVIAYNIFNGKKIASILASETDIEVGIKNANNKIKSYMGFSDGLLVDTIRQQIMNFIFRSNEQGELHKRYRSFDIKGGTIL